jgi:hypothetical protein
LEGVPGPLGPVQPPERLLLLDVLRGAAVLGMLLANNNAWAYNEFLLTAALAPSTACRLSREAQDSLPFRGLGWSQRHPPPGSDTSLESRP